MLRAAVIESPRYAFAPVPLGATTPPCQFDRVVQFPACATHLVPSAAPLFADTIAASAAFTTPSPVTSPCRQLRSSVLLFAVISAESTLFTIPSALTSPGSDT